LPTRFIFRQVYYKDIATFLNDGEVRSKSHDNKQACHQTSYQEIVDRRGTSEFSMPCGGVVNDYVPFYFSPITAFSFTIYKGNVALRSPDGTYLGVAQQSDRAFLVAKADKLIGSGLPCYFSNIALNTLSSEIKLGSSEDAIEDIVKWSLFDESPKVAHIPEIGYEGVCSYFHNRDTPVEHQNRRKERMAEFLVRQSVPMDLIECIVVHNTDIEAAVKEMVESSRYDIPVYVKPGCFF
jgi:hypothetical protein